jgi:tetratricopeptide (TPR) repeat protein
MIIGSIRGQYLWEFQGNNPLWYRFLNWKAAFAMFRDHPFLGTGIFTFGKLYPQYMVIGANESQFAHNSYLQIASELGLLGITGAGWFVGYWVRTVFNKLRDSYITPAHPTMLSTLREIDIRFFCCLSGLGFLMHNLVDFDLYVFSLGGLGVSLLALTLNLSTPDLKDNTARFDFGWPYSVVAALLLLCGLVTLYVIDWQYTQGQRYQEATEIALLSSNYKGASSSIQHALRSTPPEVPDYRATYGSVLLYLKQPEAAIQQFEIAIRQEPITPWFHAGLAAAYVGIQNRSLAYLESRRAAELFPYKPSYQKQVEEFSTFFPAM